MRDPFPLQWPDGWKRTPADNRHASRFFYGFAESLRSVLDELERIGAVNVVITSDLPTRPNGMPYAQGRKLVSDPGIAVWFVMEGQERVIASDRWRSHAENLRAIALSVEAIRGLARWGATDLIARAFQGFSALPAGEGPRHWREVLGVAPGTDQCRAEVLRTARDRWRTMMKQAHPDVGGTAERATELNLAMQEAERELGRTS